MAQVLMPTAPVTNNEPTFEYIEIDENPHEKNTN